MGNAAEETSYIYYEESKDLHTEQGYIKEVKAHYPPDLLNLYVPGDYLDFVVDYVEMEGRLQPRVTLRPSPRKAYNAISADHWFVCPARSFAQALSANQSEFVGRFLYTHVLPGPLGFYGASHGFASVFVFGTFGYYEDKQWNPTPDELILRTKFQKTWGDFARWGSPGAFWNRYDAAQDNYVMFNTSMSSGTQLRTRQCDHWDEVDRPAAGIRPAAEVQPADVFVGAVKSVARPRIVNEGSLPQIGGQK